MAGARGPGRWPDSRVLGAAGCRVRHLERRHRGVGPGRPDLQHQARPRRHHRGVRPDPAAHSSGPAVRVPSLVRTVTAAFGCCASPSASGPGPLSCSDPAQCPLTRWVHATTVGATSRSSRCRVAHPPTSWAWFALVPERVADIAAIFAEQPPPEHPRSMPVRWGQRVDGSGGSNQAFRKWAPWDSNPQPTESSGARRRKT